MNAVLSKLKMKQPTSGSVKLLSALLLHVIFKNCFDGTIFDIVAI